jgi:FkbM family methyltransferase
MVTASSLYGRARKLIGDIIPQKSTGPAARHTARRSCLTGFKHLLPRDLVVVDVGCRWGFADRWQQLSPHLVLYGFDPDAAECERLRNLYKDQPNTHLVPLGLADASGERTLYMTREMACSSLYRPDPVLTGTLPELACASETGTSKIEVTTLDEWCASNAIPNIDFIKLDTQGAELDVLRGGERTLATVGALEVEVEFNPIYINQPLFGDVDKFLREKGFVLWKLSTMAHYSRADVALEPEEQNTNYYDSQVVSHAVLSGQLYWGHAYYVRKQLASSSASRDWQQSLRDAILMDVLGFHGLAKQLLIDAIGNGAPPEVRSGLAND